MIALRAPSLERALSELAPTTARLVRSCRLELTLPAGVTEAPDGDALIVALDAASLAEAATQLGAVPAGRRVAWVMPLAAPGMVGWAFARMRCVSPLVLEDACDALRRAGLVELRVTRIEGGLPTVVVSGRTTAA